MTEKGWRRQRERRGMLNSFSFSPKPKFNCPNEWPGYIHSEESNWLSDVIYEPFSPVQISHIHSDFD